MVEVDVIIDENGKMTMKVSSTKGEDPACLVATTIKEALRAKGLFFQDGQQQSGKGHGHQHEHTHRIVEGSEG